MSEKEKMLSGQLYNPSDDKLDKMRIRSHDLCHKYNSLSEKNETRKTILADLVPNIGSDCDIQGPLFFDYGEFITIGDKVFINYNFTVLDCAQVSIGSNVMIGPNVSLLPPVHPLRFQQRNIKRTTDGKLYNYEYAKPITIKDNCWLAGNVTVIGGVTIGEGSVIGAGSVVTKDIPANSLAVGNPCKVVREITYEDSLELPNNAI